MEWRFELISPQTTKVNPSHLEFFRSEALEDPVSALVREDIQNRLDARNKSSGIPAVRVRYYLSDETTHVPPERTKRWLEALDPHLNARKSLEELGCERINLARSMPYLVIEDFNTTGLKGDPMVTADPEDDADRNDFYWFVRNVGRTGKRAGDRGRWGLGKIVYPASSIIRSFYCYSVRTPDLRESLIGRSVLAIHAIDKSEYQSEGYWADFPRPDFPYFAAPHEGKEIIREFKEAFRITRNEKENGLSLVIPFPDTSITESALIVSVIQHYFWEILRGNLEVEVAHKDASVSMTSTTINDIVMTWAGLEPDMRQNIQNRLEFCRKADAMKLNDPGYYELKKPGSYGGSKLSDLFASEAALDDACERFRKGDIVALELDVAVKKKNAHAHDSSVLVYLQRDDKLDKPDETFIRDGLTIIGEKYIREAGVRALVLADDPVITEFLGDAENPAHTKWLHTTKHFRGKYDPGKALLDYIKTAALRLANILGKVENEMLENLLDDLFGIPSEEGDENEDKKPGTQRGTKKPGKDGFERKRYLETTRLIGETGFKVQMAEGARTRPERIVIRMAYEVDSGDPFKQHHPSDFNLADSSNAISCELHHCRELLRGPNRLEIEPDDDDFHLKVVGFDSNRDLRIDVRPQLPDKQEASE